VATNGLKSKMNHVPASKLHSLAYLPPESDHLNHGVASSLPVFILPLGEALKGKYSRDHANLGPLRRHRFPPLAMVG
jgi:hypothetical protein